MNKAHIFLLALVLFAGESTAKDVHPEWYSCKQDAECAMVSGDCGVAWAANKNFTAQSRENRYYDCTKPLESHPADTAAVCETQSCVLSPRGWYAGGTSIIDQLGN